MQNRYIKTNHLGNVLEVVTDRKLQMETAPESGILDYYVADVIRQEDYFPFGMSTGVDSEEGTNYRYGFQGQEDDSEIKGEGNSTNYKYRMHDPRVGRFFAVDPLTKKYPHYTPYSFSGNKPIAYIELEGLEEYSANNISNPGIVIWNIFGRRPGERYQPRIKFVSNNSTGGTMSIERDMIENEVNIGTPPGGGNSWVQDHMSITGRTEQVVSGSLIRLNQTILPRLDNSGIWRRTDITDQTTGARSIGQIAGGAALWPANSVHNDINGTVGGAAGATTNIDLAVAGGTNRVQVSVEGLDNYNWTITDQNGNIIVAQAAGTAVGAAYRGFAVPAGVTSMTLTVTGGGGGAGATGFSYDIVTQGADATAVDVNDDTLNENTGSNGTATNNVSGVQVNQNEPQGSSDDPANY